MLERAGPGAAARLLQQGGAPRCAVSLLWSAVPSRARLGLACHAVLSCQREPLDNRKGGTAEGSL